MWCHLLARFLAALLLASPAFANTNDTGAPPAPADTPAAVTAAEPNTVAPAPVASPADAAALDERLARLEAALAAQRERELAALQQSQRWLLLTLAIFGGVGCVGAVALATALVMILARRPALPAAVTPPGLAPWPAYGPAGAPATPTTALAPLNPVEQSTSRFLTALERLEQRLGELEQMTGSAAERSASRPAASAADDRAARVALLLGKGQALLDLQQPDGALACFEEVIRLDPTHAQAFVQKAAALEKLNRLDEAIDCYDRAIALDNSLTMAYLRKGGVFNRLERFSEALQCYEQALRAQQKPRIG